MQKIKARYIISIIIIIVGAALVYAFEYNTFYRAQDAVSTIKNIPLQIEDWQGKDAFMAENVYDILETRAIIHRNYQSSKQKVFLSLVFYPDTKVDFHAPEACLGGSGRKVKKSSGMVFFQSNNSPVTLSINQLIYHDRAGKELVYYFYKAGSYLGKNYILLRLSLAKNKLAGHGSSGSLIRISTVDELIDGVSADARLKNFIADLYPYLLRYL